MTTPPQGSLREDCRANFPCWRVTKLVRFSGCCSQTVMSSTRTDNRGRIPLARREPGHRRQNPGTPEKALKTRGREWHYESEAQPGFAANYCQFYCPVVRHILLAMRLNWIGNCGDTSFAAARIKNSVSHRRELENVIWPGNVLSRQRPGRHVDAGSRSGFVSPAAVSLLLYAQFHRLAAARELGGNGCYRPFPIAARQQHRRRL